MIITITGLPGSGNSSLAKNLSRKLGYNNYSIGDLRKKMAIDRGMTLAELNNLGEKESWTDVEVDNYQKELGRKEDNFIMDAKIGYHFIPHSFKIYLTANLNVRAERIFKDARKSEPFKSVEEAKKYLLQRVKSDKKRYKKYYEIETYSGKEFDFVLDTTHLSIEKVLDKVLKKLKTFK